MQLGLCQFFEKLLESLHVLLESLFEKLVALATLASHLAELSYPTKHVYLG